MNRLLHSAAIVFVALLFNAARAPAGGKETIAKQDPQKADRLVIHEWGTFTCLQDEAGHSITGVNTDDEAVPEFVHRMSDLVPRPSELAPVYYKGVPRSHRQVRMRLETPVLYFYPPAGARGPLHATVQVGFRGGWLTEYYPAAKVEAPGLQEGNFRFSGLTSKTTGTLEWHDLTIGGNYRLPETTAPVWLAPRQVRAAATVKAPGGEAEKYLFYRGVGNLPSPISVTRTIDNDGIVIREDLPSDLQLRAPLSIRAMWLVHVREDGSVAYRPLGAAKLTGQAGRELTRTPVEFSGNTKADGASDAKGEAKSGLEPLIEGYKTTNLAALRGEMHKELIADGLYPDEADAMLKTWELAYFKSPGLRLFYLLPQQWTDAVLPLKCSLLAEVSRTMVGRIELVTPKQRALLKQLGSGPVSEINWMYAQLDASPSRNEILAKLWQAEFRFQDLNMAVPRDYQAYIDLGRFRNALILDEHTRHPNSGLGRFVDAYKLDYYTPAELHAETSAPKVGSNP